MQGRRLITFDGKIDKKCWQIDRTDKLIGLLSWHNWQIGTSWIDKMIKWYNWPTGGKGTAKPASERSGTTAVICEWGVWELMSWQIDRLIRCSKCFWFPSHFNKFFTRIKELKATVLSFSKCFGKIYETWLDKILLLRYRQLSDCDDRRDARRLRQRWAQRRMA